MPGVTSNISDISLASEMCTPPFTFSKGVPVVGPYSLYRHVVSSCQIYDHYLRDASLAYYKSTEIIHVNALFQC